MINVNLGISTRIMPGSPELSQYTTREVLQRNQARVFLVQDST